MPSQVSLLVNDQPIPLESFAQGFIDSTVGGMLAGLKGTAVAIASVNIAIEGDRVNINLNNNVVPANPFVSKIIKSTVDGMVSSLKGVGEIKRVNIKIQR